MNLLLLSPGKIPANIDEIKCFSDTWAYFLTNALKKHCLVKTVQIQEDVSKTLHKVAYFPEDAVICLGLRYFSNIDPEIVTELSQTYNLCQIHDGSRLDADKVITFTLRDDTHKYIDNESRLKRHQQYNKYVGWAADSDLNCPKQDSKVLRLLVDHTNYGPNHIDYTENVLSQIKELVDSKVWSPRFESVSVRRFDTGCVLNVDFDQPITRYDRTKHIPYSKIVEEHCAAHVFFVTHPESVGQVVLETAIAGAYIVTPRNCIPKDRLETVNHYSYSKNINWDIVMENLNPVLNRNQAIVNSWDEVANNIIREIQIMGNT